jgi:dihydrolipoamide dehydrogenase
MAESSGLHIAVVGAGPGGYAAAFLAADLGLKVTFIDPEAHPGGVCVHRGCIPSKALLHVASLLAEAEQAGSWGIGFQRPTIDLSRLRSWKKTVVNRLTGGLDQLSKLRAVHYIQGRAAFRASNTLTVTSIEGREETLQFDRIVLATGSRPAVVRGLAVNSPRVMDSTTALELPDIPQRLLVVGGGYIGLELGSVYAALGSRVTCIEALPGLLAGADHDVVQPLKRRLDKLFESIRLNTNVVSLEEEETGIRATMKATDGTASEALFDRVLMAVGRKPNSEISGLERTNVQVDDRGFIRVNAQLRTTDPVIYAIGDVAGEPMLAHKLMHEGRTAVAAIAGHKVAFEPRAIPAVVFTDPEVAWAGLTETQAKKQGRVIAVARFGWGASGRAITLDRPEGVTKLIIDPKSEVVLGVGICGAGAGELIAEGVLAIEMGARAPDLELTIHPHPTLSETVMEAAEVFFGRATDVYRPARKSRIAP